VRPGQWHNFTCRQARPPELQARGSVRSGSHVRFWERDGSGSPRAGALRCIAYVRAWARKLGKHRLSGPLSDRILCCGPGGRGFESHHPPHLKLQVRRPGQYHGLAPGFQCPILPVWILPVPVSGLGITAGRSGPTTAQRGSGVVGSYAVHRFVTTRLVSRDRNLAGSSRARTAGSKGLTAERLRSAATIRNVDANEFGGVGGVRRSVLTAGTNA